MTRCIAVTIAFIFVCTVVAVPERVRAADCTAARADGTELYYTDRERAGDAQLYNGERARDARRRPVISTGAISAAATRAGLLTCPTQSAFYTAIERRFVAAAGRQLLVYVHGYYTTFVTAAKDIAAIQKSLKFRGPVVLYSWPSKVTSRLAYVNDESNAEWSHVAFRNFLATVEKKYPNTIVSFATHSLGGRFATDGMSLLRHIGCAKACFGRAILFAPDVDSGTALAEFGELGLCDSPPKRDPKRAAAVTMYVSNRDLALRQSQRIHGHQRAGQAGSEIILCGGVDTIDVGYRRFADAAGHTYQTDPRVLRDAAAAFAGTSPAAPSRKLKAVDRDAGTYYELR